VTGGVVVTGEVGCSFGAVAFVDDAAIGGRVHEDVVVVALAAEDRVLVRALLSQHLANTGSPRASSLLENDPAGLRRRASAAEPTGRREGPGLGRRRLSAGGAFSAGG